MNKNKINEIREIFLVKEKHLSKHACLSSDAIYYKDEDLSSDFRPPFSHDIDRIIHALSYTRYMKKTQVFSYLDNDHVSKRIVHVQLVSKIARTIGRALSLNEDLIEAIALGHDIGHTPLGHEGEHILNRISLRELGLMFNHNINSVRTYVTLENYGKGLNLTIQTLDGIMCHNGEILCNEYAPVKKTKEEFLKEYEMCYQDKEILKKIRPMTLEGCVVRISDIVGYIGRDIEDAITIGLLKRKDIPKDIIKTLGVTNAKIVDTIIKDIITNSMGKPYIKMSEEIFQAILKLKKFNYENIYHKANTKEELEMYDLGMNLLYEECLKDLKTNNKHSLIYKEYISNADIEYINNTVDKQIVIDYLAGMTDDYFIDCVKQIKK